MPMKVHVANHPLIAHKLTVLRDERTDSPTFRRLVEELVTLLAYEATRDIRTHSVEITTPVTKTKGLKMAEPRPVVVPILRAGLGMLDGFLNILPEASVAHVGLARNEDTLQPECYYHKSPEHIAEADIIVLDPMLATGGSACAAIEALKQQGAKHLVFVCMVAAPEGVNAINLAHPDVTVYYPALDNRLNEHGYILPGLGDAGDRIFGTC